MFRFPLPLPSGTPSSHPVTRLIMPTLVNLLPASTTRRVKITLLSRAHFVARSPVPSAGRPHARLLLTLASPHYLSLAKGGLLSPASSAANPSPHLRASPGYLLLPTSDVTPRKCPPSPAQLLAALSIRSTLCFLSPHWPSDCFTAVSLLTTPSLPLGRVPCQPSFLYSLASCSACHTGGT